LTAWVALVMVLSYAALFVAVYRGTGTELRDDIDQEIRGDSLSFTRVLAAGDAGDAGDVARVALRYVDTQPFSANATVLFAVIPGVGIRTNQPDLFRDRPPDHGESKAQQAAENGLDRRLLSYRDGLSTVALADAGPLRLLKTRLRVGSTVLTAGVGESLATVSRAQFGVARIFFIAGGLMLLLALLASYVVGTQVSGPLRRMAAVAARVDAGELDPRIRDGHRRRDEIRVLAEAFNTMLDRLSRAFASQRAFVADASHELRTPLTVIRGQLEVLAAHPDPSAVEVRRVERLVQDEITRLSRLANDLLLLARTDEPEFLRLAPIELQPFVTNLWAGVIGVGERHFDLGVVPAGVLRADADRLAQAIRNLTANAMDHTSPGDGLVSLNIAAGDSDRIRFVVADDGPGIPVDQRDRVFDRFYRTDRARNRTDGGTGLGLAIVRAIVLAHGGSVAASDRPGGGTQVVIELPGFTPAGDRPQQGRDERPQQRGGRA
jgi:signal transduction histidine kinase